jgi:FKBP-type peptidyl-prolyl cis-trans isomerase FklB
MASRIVAAATLALVTCAAAAQEKPARPEVGPPKSKASYAIGVDLVNNFRNQGIEVETEPLLHGIRDALEGKPLEMSDAELKKVLRDYQAVLRRNQVLDRQIAGAENTQLGAAFRAEYAKRDGTRKLGHGILCRVLKEGTGKKPAPKDRVEARMTGRLIDGTEFEKDEGNAVRTLSLAEVIPGLREAILAMPIGSHWEVVLPADTAYGSRGAGRFVKAGMTLVYDIDLVGIRAP